MLFCDISSKFHQKVEGIKVVKERSHVRWRPPFVVLNVDGKLLLILNLNDVVNQVDIVVACSHMEDCDTITLSFL